MNGHRVKCIKNFHNLNMKDLNYDLYLDHDSKGNVLYYVSYDENHASKFSLEELLKHFTSSELIKLERKIKLEQLNKNV